MSNAPQALERSVLERKERDELTAIAEAMGVKPSSRASKATIIDQILREAGIESGARPAGGRSRSAPSEPTTNGSEQPQPGLFAEATPADTGNGATSNGSEQAPVSTDQPTAAGGSQGAEQSEGATVVATTVPDANGEGPSTAEETTGAEASAGVRTDERSRDRNWGSQREGRDHRGSAEAQAGPDSGNRRSRRRRGRDRGERDIQHDRGAQETSFSGEPIPVEGLLDLREEGYGFLRARGYLATSNDVYVSVSQVRRFNLRKGDMITGASRPASSNEKYPALLRIDTVNGMTVEEARSRPRFEDLTPLFPDQKLRLEVPGDAANMVARIVDLISPIGKGQRGLIVSPPKAGKTTVLKQIARSIEANNPEVHLMVLLVDERPEEVTDMRRSVKGEVIASTFDRPSDEHTQVAELAIERAKRLVEMGRDVVIVLDGITRLARAYNLAAPATGRIMSGGIDTGALYPPKKFFGAARNLEEGGSLTILATALIETGSKMDEVIFEEFKGTGNMELRLDRKLAERRIYPAIEVNGSSTRHEELLFERGQLPQVWKLRRVLNALEGGAGLELLMDKIRTTKSNDEFLAEIAKAPTPTG